MKLHEILSIQNGLENQVSKVRADLLATFEKKRHLFEEKRLDFTPTVEGEQAAVESQSDLQSTVSKELTWIQGHLTKRIDAEFQISETNTKARADIVLDDNQDTILAKDVPATALLELEKRIAEVKSLIMAVPTLDPAKGFTPDPNRGEGIYKAREIIKDRTRKTPKVIIKYEATKEHPAQTELVHVDIPIGKLRETEWSGLISPAEKAVLLDRAEMVERAVRRARSRANDCEVDTSKKIGANLLKYVFNGIK